MVKAGRSSGFAFGLLIVFLLSAFSVNAQFPLQLKIVPTYESNPIVLDSLRYKLPGGETFSVTRLSYLLSGFALERKTGGWVELPGEVAWMNAETHRDEVVLTNIPDGEYRSLRFAVGLAPVINDADPSGYPAENPLNPNLNNLHWSWQGGYIFLALEGHFRIGNEVPRGYSYHFARNPNRTMVTLPLESNTNMAVTITFDIAALLNAPRPLSFLQAESTHSRDGDPVAEALRVNLASAFQIRSISVPAIESALLPVKPLYMPAKFTPYPFTFSGKFPIPALPRDNPLIKERVALGQRLFNEPLLSRNISISCASCHDPQRGFTDPRRFSLGVDGQPGTRHAMRLSNLAWKSSFFWDGRAPSLRAQAMVPIQDHTEMDENFERLCAKLAPSYSADFARAFDNADITAEKIGLALENFVLTLTSNNSRFDQALRGHAQLSAEEKRGFELFFTEYDPRTKQYGADCFHCHGGALFTDNQFHNNGLDADSADIGLGKITGKPGDRAKFATPSLRNVVRTGPYMHDGRFQTLDEVIEHYATGTKRSATLDPNLAKHPDGGVPLSAADKKALVAFLKTLSEETQPRREVPE